MNHHIFICSLISPSKPSTSCAVMSCLIYLVGNPLVQGRPPPCCPRVLVGRYDKNFVSNFLHHSLLSSQHAMQYNINRLLLVYWCWCVLISILHFLICMAFMFEKYSMSISDTTFGAGSDIHIQLSQISHSVQTCNE